MTNVYLHADAHGGHKNVHRFRDKFTSEVEHFEYIAHQYNNTVRKNDLVYFLGDVAFTKERLEDIKKWSGRKILILGNHDSDKDVNIIDIVNSCTYEEIHSLKKYKSHFWLSHAPIHPDELRGRINIHGHVHMESIKLADGTIDDRYFNACIEHHDYNVVAMDTIKAHYGIR